MKKLFLSFVLISLVYVGYLNSPKYDKYPKGVRNAFRHSSKSQKDEFEKVLHHFSTEKDSLKLKCAYVLIANLHLHSYRKEPEVFNEIVDSIYELKHTLLDNTKSLKYNERTLKKIQDSYVNMINTLYHEPGGYKKVVKDINTVNASFLIENINLAFEAHNKLPQKYKANFDDFCNYVIPYRNGTEPIEFHKRKELNKKYSWVYDSIQTKPLEDIVIQIYNDVKINIDFKRLSKLKLNPTPSQIEKLQYGLCTDVANYFVLLFRSLGFSAGTDFITSYGNRHSAVSHSWFFIKYDNTSLAVQAGSKSLGFSNIDRIFKLTSMPKVYRRIFNKVNYKNSSITTDTDVTNMYRPTSTVQIENTLKNGSNENYKLCVFNNKSNWFKVDDNFKIIKNKVVFENVGRGILYAVTNKRLEPINHPFYLDYKGNLVFLKNEKNKEDVSFKVSRKYPPIDLPNNWKIDRIKLLNNCKLQGSNSLDEKTFQDIYTIKNFFSTHKYQFLFNKELNYKYYRLVAGEETSKTTYIAEFALLDMQLNSLKNVKIDFYGTAESKITQKLKISDNNGLTFGRFSNMSITFEVENNQNVIGFEIQARNDDNHINIGEEYELMVFDKTWRSIRKEVAKDTVLDYHNLAENGLYLLHNLTKGKEEHVFTFDKNGNQFWFGVSDVSELEVGPPISSN